jgi:transmembrane sensor
MQAGADALAGRVIAMAMTPQANEISAEAARWHVLLEGEAASEADWLAFEHWLAAAPAHRAAYNAIDAALIDAGLHRDALSVEDSPARNAAPPRSWMRRPAAWAIGAAALAACAALLLWRPAPPIAEYAYEASATADQRVTLADGSTVHLNRNAAIHVRFGAVRHVTLDRGEAAFDVAHDGDHPFEVAVGDSVIRDIGTVFNVARNPDSTVVTVQSGEVEIGANAARTRVVAGYQARIPQNGAIALSAANQDAFAWQSGQLIYRDAPIAQVIEDLNRYSQTPIVASGEIMRLRFSGVLNIDDAQSMLARLEAFLPIRAVPEDGRIVVGSAS